MDVLEISFAIAAFFVISISNVNYCNNNLQMTNQTTQCLISGLYYDNELDKCLALYPLITLHDGEH